MTSALAAVPSALLWAVVLLRVRTLRRDAVQRTLWLGLVVVAVAMTVDIPAVSHALEKGVPNLIFLLMHSLVLLAAWAARETLRGIALPEEEAAAGRRRRALFYTGSVAALSVAFVLAPVHSAQARSFTGAADFTTVYATRPAIDAYWVIYLGVLASTLAAITLGQIWFVRRAPKGSLRTGMLLLGAGSAFGLLYVAHKAGYIALRQSGVTGGWYIRDDARTGAVLVAVGVGLTALGMLWPARYRPRPIRACRTWATLRSLYPLWRAVWEGTPAIGLAPPPAGGRDRFGRLRDLEARLYDRVIEIRDGVLALRPYVPENLPAAAARAAEAAPIPAHLRGPAATALCLAAARQAKLAGRPAVHQDVDADPLAALDLTWDAELRDVTLLARGWRCAERVAATAAEATRAR